MKVEHSFSCLSEELEELQGTLEKINISTVLRSPLTKGVSVEHTKVPGNSDPKRCFRKVGTFKGFKVMIDRRFSQMISLRYFLSKFVYEPEEGLHLEEWLALQSLYYEFWLKLEADDLFATKYVKDFSLSHWFVEGIGKAIEFPAKIAENLEDVDLSTSVPLLLTQWQYFGLKEQGGPSAILIFHDQSKKRTAKRKRQMGVGYRDKGSRRDTAVDGNPHWKEVYKFLCSKEELQDQETAGRNVPLPVGSPIFVQWDRPRKE